MEPHIFSLSRGSKSLINFCFTNPSDKEIRSNYKRLSTLVQINGYSLKSSSLTQLNGSETYSNGLDTAILSVNGCSVSGKYNLSLCSSPDLNNLILKSYQ